MPTPTHIDHPYGAKREPGREDFLYMIKESRPEGGPGGPSSAGHALLEKAAPVRST